MRNFIVEKSQNLKSCDMSVIYKNGVIQNITCSNCSIILKVYGNKLTMFAENYYQHKPLSACTIILRKLQCSASVKYQEQKNIIIAVVHKN